MIHVLPHSPLIELKAIPVQLGWSCACGKSVQKVEKICHCNSYLSDRWGEGQGHLGAFLTLESGSQGMPRWGTGWNSASLV